MIRVLTVNMIFFLLTSENEQMFFFSQTYRMNRLMDLFINYLHLDQIQEGKNTFSIVSFTKRKSA